MIERSAQEWQKTVASLEDQVVNLRRLLAERHTEVDILDLRYYKVEQSRQNLVRHLRYAAAGSKWRQLAVGALSTSLAQAQLSETERLTARGTCYLHFKMWRITSRSSAQRRQMAANTLTFTQAQATRRLGSYVLQGVVPCPCNRHVFPPHPHLSSTSAATRSHLSAQRNLQRMLKGIGTD